MTEICLCGSPMFAGRCTAERCIGPTFTNAQAAAIVEADAMLEAAGLAKWRKENIKWASKTTHVTVAKDKR